MTVRTILFAIGVSALPFCVPLLGLTRQGGGVGVVAGVAGLLGALAMWWQVLLGARQVAARLSRDRGAVVALHRWLGGCGAFLVLVHPLLELVADRQDALYLVRIDFTWVESAYISLGRIALGLFLALWLTSTLLRAAVRHRVWRHTHYVSYPLVALVFLHADGVGSSLSGLPWLRAYWLALAWSFALVVAWRLAAPLWSRRYRLTGAERISPTVTRYTLEPVGRPLRPARPGQFCHLRAGTWARSRPFSVVRADPGTGVLEFAVKDAGPVTRRLRALPVGALLRLDGPYGAFTSQAQGGDAPAVLIAGGVGVTPFVELVRRRGRAVRLYHAVRAPEEAVFAEELAHRLGERYAPLPRPAPVHDGARYFVSGSPRFVAEVRADLRRRGVPRDRLFTEGFEW
ncbi:putative ferric reductase [Thermocatellispora tengchongensis]|uniref:Putative ferric reductase n=1 Tax=Thermocatellispora tengchongensis TaxID=1073253 RepID=A0A840P9F1_9ACTN|nr:ferredoxin reductase family protein [Thermocatellispora tengchongensis]MBB5134060.1 putative ferric reductase [Thermocatellispora tengchongensis]